MHYSIVTTPPEDVRRSSTHASSPHLWTAEIRVNYDTSLRVEADSEIDVLVEATRAMLRHLRDTRASRLKPSAHERVTL
jgi:hypothetical protein